MIVKVLEPSGPLHSNDHGWFCDHDPPAWEAAMTVVTPRLGFDLKCYLNRTSGEKTGGGYYLNAAQQGEPDAIWFGSGAEAPGLRAGQVVRREPYLAVGFCAA
jgi:hypothetical protein